jgi:hypothetical protein
MKKLVDIYQFYDEQRKSFKCDPLVGTNENDFVNLSEIIDETQGIYVSDDISENFTKDKFLKLLYSYWSVNSTDEDVERCAQHLETIFRTSINSILPCNIGDKLYFPTNKIEAYVVKEMKISDDGTRIVCYNETRDVSMVLHESYIGKTIFLDYNQAVEYQKNKVRCEKCGFARERTDGKYHCCYDNSIRSGNYSCGKGVANATE